MPISARDRRGQIGVTLFELLVVLAITAFTVTIANAAFMSASPQFALKNATAILIADLKAARLNARQNGDATIVIATVDGYEIPQLSIVRQYDQRVRAEWAGGRQEISFSSNFTSLGGQIALSTKKRRNVVVVHPIIGKIERLE